jgi:hypothetical protein
VSTVLNSAVSMPLERQSFLSYFIQGDSGGKINIWEIIVSVTVRTCEHVSNSERLPR